MGSRRRAMAAAASGNPLATQAAHPSMNKVRVARHARTTTRLTRGASQYRPVNIAQLTQTVNSFLTNLAMVPYPCTPQWLRLVSVHRPPVLQGWVHHLRGGGGDLLHSIRCPLPRQHGLHVRRGCVRLRRCDTRVRHTCGITRGQKNALQKRKKTQKNPPGEPAWHALLPIAGEQ
jgi:hypothetical protein